MKILLVIHQFLPESVGGTEYYSFWLAQGLTERHDCEVAIWSFRETPLNRYHDFGVHRTNYVGVQVAELVFNLGAAEEGQRRDWQGGFQRSFFERELDLFKPDAVIVCHAIKHSAEVFEVCASRRIPAIALITDYWSVCPLHTLLRYDGSLCSGPEADLCTACVTNTFKQWLEGSHVRMAMQERPDAMRDAFLKAERLVVLTQFAKDMFLEHGFPSTAMELIEHGPPVEQWLEPDIQPQAAADPPHILFIGNATSSKGAKLLTAALSKLPHANIRLKLVMSPQPEREYHELLKQAKLDQRITICPPFAEQETWQHMFSCAAVAVPAQWHENGSLVAKSAVLSGTPLLASEVGTLIELKEKSPTANITLLPRDKPEAWASAMLQAAENFSDSGSRLKKLDPDAAPTFLKTVHEWHRILQKVTTR